MNYYIGLDAHSTTSTAVVVDERGEIKFRQTFPTSEANLTGFVRKLPEGRKHLTLEECHLAQWLYVTLVGEVDELVVCNPTYVAKKHGAKTDFRDALHLAQELRTGHLKPVYHDNSRWIQLRVLVNNYQGLVRDIIRTKNRLKAVFRSEGVDTGDGDFYKTRERVKKLKHAEARFAAEGLYDQMEALEKQKIKYKEYFKENVRKYRPIKNLTTVPGIDLVRANIIVAVVCQPDRFRNKHQFWGYSMLVRHIQESGGKIYGNKRFHGRGELRDIFLGAAENVLRGETSLRDYYDALRAREVAHKDAKIAVARKIAAICLCLLKNNDTFKNDYDEQQTRRLETRKSLNLESSLKTS